MNKEVIKKWVAALRSGKYKQDTGQLKTSKGMCCLGVFQHINRKELNGKWDKGFFCTPLDGKEQHELTNSAKCLLDFRASRGRIGNTGLPKTKVILNKYGSSLEPYLDILNDAGATFEEIADVIEEQLMYGMIE